MPLESNTGPRLRCLSIQQPWAWMVCSGDKDIENRNWKTDFRGTIAIHASTKVTQVNGFLKRDKVKQVKRSDFECGAIIGLTDGPAIGEVIEIARSMVDADDALAVMGNHEHHAIAFHTKRPGEQDAWIAARQEASYCS